MGTSDESFLATELACSDENYKMHAEKSPVPVSGEPLPRILLNNEPFDMTLNQTILKKKANGESLSSSPIAKKNLPMPPIESPVSPIANDVMPLFPTTTTKKKTASISPKVDFNDTIEWVDYCYEMSNQDANKTIPKRRLSLLQDWKNIQ